MGCHCLAQAAQDVVGQRFLDVLVAPVLSVAERIPACQEPTGVDFDVFGSRFVVVTQVLQRPAQGIIFVIIVSPDESRVWRFDGGDLLPWQAADEDGDVASGGD